MTEFFAAIGFTLGLYFAVIGIIRAIKGVQNHLETINKLEWKLQVALHRIEVLRREVRNLGRETNTPPQDNIPSSWFMQGSIGEE